MFRGLVAALLLSVTLSLAVQAPVFAADPTPAATPAESPMLIDPLDPRAGEGASQVGAPFLAFVVVVGLGVVAASATAVFVAVSRRR